MWEETIILVRDGFRVCVGHHSQEFAGWICGIDQHAWHVVCTDYGWVPLQECLYPKGGIDLVIEEKGGFGKALVGFGGAASEQEWARDEQDEHMIKNKEFLAGIVFGF